jgi:hypothetical protein
VDKIKAGQGVRDITKSEGISEGRVWKRIRLAFLSPKLVAAILDGTTGQELTIKKLSVKYIPLDWNAQPLDNTMVRIVIPQIRRNTSGEVIVAITNECMGDSFGQHSGQYPHAT